jgi:hypothetical protein
VAFVYKQRATTMSRAAAALALTCALGLPARAAAWLPAGVPRPERPFTAATSVTSRVDSFTYLDNGVVRLGIDLSRGGTIGFLGPSSDPSFSILNAHDFGRSVQGSFYSGPNPFDPDGKCSEPGGWGRPWSWNPIGSGDVYLHAAPILNVTVAPDHSSAEVWTLPLQWACDNVPCDCTFEQHIQLRGSAVEVRLTMHTDRADTTVYPAYTQELPAVYVIGDYCHLWTFNGSAPFAGAPLAEQPATWPWSSFTSGERWMAFTNASGWGVGIVSPFVGRWGAGFFNNGAAGAYNCTPKGLGPYDSPTGYIAPWGTETIDARAPYAYTFALVLGQLDAIRAYALAEHAAGADEPLVPHYDFVSRGDRAHCFTADATDGGLPLGPRGLAFNVTGPHPFLSGPVTVFPPSAAPVVSVNASHDPSLAGAESIVWFWRLEDNVEGTPCATCLLPLPAIADGAFHVYEFALASVPEYAGAAAITRVAYQPLGAAAVDPRVYGRPGIVAVSSFTTPSSPRR